jgi:tetratricopeptide (TPR) repeat protein
MPDCGEIHFLLGCLFVRAGSREESLPSLAEACRLLPWLADAHIVLGNVLISLGRWGEAVEALQRALALTPDALLVKCNLALALYSSGEAAQSEALYEEILQSNPDNADAHANLAHILNLQERYAEAEGHARRAVELAPGSASPYNTLGVSLTGLGRGEEAESAYRRAIDLDANLLHAHLNLCRLYSGEGRHAEAEECSRRALEISPDSIHALDAESRALLDLGRWDEAIECLQRARRIAPESAAIFQRLAYASSRSGALEDAVAYGLKALELNPTAEARWNLAMDQLRTGRYREGFNSMRAMEELTGRVNPRPKWDGSALDGRTLAVYAAGGLGDTIQLARFLPEAVERARGRVILECQPSLVELLADLPGLAGVVAQEEDPYPADCYASLFALPDMFGVTEETIPCARLPLRIPEEATAIWREILAGISGLKVGLCWSVRADTLESRFRSISLERFAPLADVTGVQLISLQVGPPADQIRTARHGLDILHVPEHLSTMTETAALIRQLDLVITIDTSLAHVAGALDVETWVPNHFVPTLWWNVYRPDESPWYPRHRPFRQPRLDDWDAVIERIRQELVSRVAAPGQPPAGSSMALTKGNRSL